MSEALKLGLIMTFVGITVVFSSLVILSVVISFFPLLNPKKNKKSSNQHSADQFTAASIENGEEIENTEGDLSDDSLVAVLSAAVLASMRDRPDVKIRVTSFRRIQQTSPVWNATGRKEYISNKL